MKTALLVSSALVLSSLALACGAEKKPAQSPDNTAITETSSKEDMPPPPAKEADAPASPAATPATDGPGAAGGVIKLAAMKVAPVKKGKNDKMVELKEDGTVSIDGKPAAKIKGDQVDSVGGTSMVTVGVDGSLVGNGVNPGFKFEGDDLVHESGVKLSVGDDGTITATKDGKSDPVAKVEGGASAKRAALILAVLWMNVPTSKDAKPAAASKPAKK